MFQMSKGFFPVFFREAGQLSPVDIDHLANSGGQGDGMI
jgi:hypothetical protein